MDDLWWLPSLIVFAGAGIVVWLLVSLLRRRNPKTPVASIDDLHRRAGIALVRTDDAVREAEDEVGFAEAEFGRAEARGYAADVAAARAALGEAFRLRQALEDEIPDTELQRREWNERITRICEDVDRTLAARLKGFAERRVEERSAPDQLEELRARIEGARERLTTTGLSIASAAERYAAAALADASALRRAAQEAVDRAVADAEQATQRIASGQATTSTLKTLARDVQQAEQRLEAVERSLAGISAAETELAVATRELQSVITEADALRSRVERPESADVITSAVEHARRSLLHLAAPRIDGDASALPDPVRRLELLRAAEVELDAALATARSAQQRIENAREAMRGAIFTADSHIQSAVDYISANRNRVGADARTRLAEAIRQFSLAEAAAGDDPVEALDIARRASRIAQDADALARYDAGSGY
ncbi:hypothetical protein KXS11_09245 [Plantibacter flavus]|uniref:hypothetical protein n=1 Tax=Plantibacter flavus TaxID=150123 RepID=UPI003F178149